MTTSSLGWIDFSSEHRERVRTVIDLLAAPGVVDELGIGVIRDAFSDTLFPGISTIQTRPKYFILVPRILKDYESLPDKRRQQIPLEDYLAWEELACRVKLAERYGSREGMGVIGITFGTRTDRDVQRRPSSVYWNGLCTFGLVKSPVSLAEYCRRYGGHRPSLRMMLEETRDQLGDDVDAEDVNLSPIAPLPEARDWKEDLSITLTPEEAQFLRHKICASQPDTLIGQLLLEDGLADAFAGLSEKSTFSEMVALIGDLNLPDQRLLRVARQARDFWEILYGAHIRYNVLLQGRFGTLEKQQERVEEWEEWRTRMQAFDWRTLQTEDIWHLVAEHGSHPPPWTKRFVNGWLEACQRGEHATRVFDDLVTDQENYNKRSRSRLRADNKETGIGDWIGIKQLDYRLPQVWRLVTDIRRAERKEADPDAGH